ncbi:ABC transporter ATP-binding protein [Litoreibacter roseus]|uniref:ABC transporter ATP-binding protein n=2 Tax=Litoreibacter roseus TaxID=2601869 RepID=A0A6N6JJ52_9RHOB|nr:ABC transporter ATP-binding protein [Litoreibacter roseus]
MENVPKHKRLFLLSFLCIFAVAIAQGAFAFSMRFMVDDVFVAKNVTAVWLVGGGIIAISVIKGIAVFLRMIISSKVKRSILSSLQRRQFDKLIRTEMSYFAGRHPSEFISDIFYNARGSVGAVMTLTIKVTQDAVMLIVLSAVMIFQDPLMSIGAFVAVPFVFWIFRKITKRIKELAKVQAQLQASLTSSGVEAVQGVQTVKSFGLEEKLSRRFAKAIQTLERRVLKIARTQALSSPLMEIVGGILIGSFLMYGGWQSVSSGTTPGEFMAFLTAFLLAYEPAKRLAAITVKLQSQMIAIERLYAFLDMPETTGMEKRTAVLKSPRGEIEFNDVNFSYPENGPALHDVSFTVSPGEFLAIVGRSGAGKTTIANLLLGFLTAKSGTITLDGIDISTVDPKELSKNIALISQDVFLFDGTIRDNIRDGNPNASNEQIEEAAKAAEILGFLEKTDAGLDTEVGTNGSNLSGGQRQRVAIARALVKDAPAIIYDEATSALDGEVERSIVANTLHGNQDRAIIAIAHRLSTIQGADRIIVMDAGKVISVGTHDSLKDSCDVYRSIFNLDTLDESAVA